LNAALIKFFEPVMLSGTDYYPFGMAMRVGQVNYEEFIYNSGWSFYNDQTFPTSIFREFMLAINS
jgi:hypothetical protein